MFAFQVVSSAPPPNFLLIIGMGRAEVVVRELHSSLRQEVFGSGFGSLKKLGNEAAMSVTSVKTKARPSHSRPTSTIDFLIPYMDGS